VVGAIDHTDLNIESSETSNHAGLAGFAHAVSAGPM